MALITQAPRGVQDVLPAEVYRWQAVENTMRQVVQRHGYREIRLPTFEHTELFARGVGDTTDIVGKEMYTFTDRGGPECHPAAGGAPPAPWRALLQGRSSRRDPCRCGPIT